MAVLNQDGQSVGKVTVTKLDLDRAEAEAKFTGTQANFEHVKDVQ